MAEATADSMVPADADDARRFGGLDRLYGIEAAQYLRRAHVVVVGLGGVGSWAAEALARSGISRLTLIDMDHIAESNINRQIHALSSTLGQSKIEAMRERIAQIHPRCEVQVVDDFVSPDNWPGLLPGEVDGVLDCCDQVKAKHAIVSWALKAKVPTVCMGAAGGKRRAERLECGDLADVTHDPLLASLRQRMRKFDGAPRQGRMKVSCVFSREAVTRPPQEAGQACAVDHSLNCAGYGSSVMVTASMGLIGANALVEQLLKP